jgi:predicted exporter
MRARTAAIMQAFDQLSKLTKRQEKVANLFTEILVSGQQELNDKITELQQAVADDEAQDQQIVDQLDAQIQTLKDQIASNQPIDTQSQIDALEAIKEQLKPSNSTNIAGGGLGAGGTPQTPPSPDTGSTVVS